MDGVLGAIDGNLAELFADVLFARLAVPVVHDVVFGFRVLGPAVDTDVTVRSVTRLGVLVIDSKTLRLVVNAVTIVLVAHAGQVVAGATPVGLERTVAVVGHRGVATLIPLFKTPGGSTDRTNSVATHLSAVSRMAHIVIASICSEGRRRKTHN